ncbi:transcription factor SPT20 homolog [Panthera pardus]|uniref:Transcription factor SPT20 homolog n=1 Tax=Panthera pardus TaxID=9691 RepID=A0A9W2UN87_PANPR|nr:transcription factor SPT20 homolog [Panthera pardus]
MQQSLEQAPDRADYIIASAQQSPPKRKGSASGGASLDEKLYDLYVEECGKEPEATEELRSNVNLLEKLLRRESLPCLVVNLYPGKEGYSLMLEGENGSYSETIRLPYEEGELLEYLDAEQLPPALVDLLEKSQVNFFHSGCVIAQVRDYRQCSREPPGYASRHVLLRPTMQTLACDVQSMSSDDQTWTQEDRLLLESQLILATAKPLCLDPSVSVACTANRLLYNKQKMNTGPMKRSFKRYSAPSLNRQQELSHRPPPPELRVWPSYKKSRESTTSENCDFIISKPGNYVDTWKQRPCDLAVPSEVDVQKYAKWETFVKYDESQPTDWPAHEAKDDFEFGYESGDESQTKPAFMQSLNDPFISGKRRVRKKIRHERQASPPHSSTGDHSTSVLPRSKSDAGREVIQSQVLVKQKAKCPVTVSHGSSGSASLSQLPPGKETEQPEIVFVQSSVLGKELSHPSPAIKPPSSSGKTWSGNSFTPWQGSTFLKSPSPAPASKPPSPSQKSPVEVNPISTFPAATLSTTGSLQRTLATQVMANSAGPNIIQVVGTVSGVQAWARDSSLRQGSTTGATAPAGIKPSNLPSGSWPPNVGPPALQAPSQAGAQFFFKDAPSIRPVSMFQLPQGSYLLNTQQLNTQQQPQQQWLYQLIPQQQLQQPTASSQQPTAPHPQQPVSQGSSAQGSTSQRTALSAQQAVVLNLAGAGSLLQPLQAAVLSPLGCVESQRRPEQSGAQHTLQLSSALQLQPQQQVQLRILPHPVALTTVAAPTAQPHPSSEQTANQSTGKMKKGTPTTPKS